MLRIQLDQCKHLYKCIDSSLPKHLLNLSYGHKPHTQLYRRYINLNFQIVLVKLLDAP